MGKKLLLLFLILHSFFPLSGEKKRGFWTDPDSIDPLKVGASSFLSVDLGEYFDKAYKAMGKKEYYQAAQLYLFILHHRPDDGEALYNLACAYAGLGEPKMAVPFLERAFETGRFSLEQIRRDSDFQPLAGEKSFDEALKRMGEEEAGRGKWFYFAAPRVARCRIHIPEGFDARKSYPLLVGLHGYGGSADEFGGIWKFMQGKELIYVALEAPYPFPPSGRVRGSHYSWSFPDQNPELGKLADPLVAESVEAVVRQISSRYSLKGVYLFGFSQGAVYAYYCLSQNPELYQGVIAFGGHLPLKGVASPFREEELARAKGVKIFIAHGRQDPVADFREALLARDDLKRLGFDVTFSEFQGGHSIPPSVLSKALLWMGGL